MPVPPLLGASTLRRVIAASVLTTVCATAHAQSIFKPNTDGAVIEKRLQNLAADCFGSYAKYGPEFFPKELRTKFQQRLDRPLTPERDIPEVRFELLARSVLLPDKPIHEQLRAAPRSLPIQIDLPPAEAISDADSIVYGLTCGTQIKLALDQGFKFSLIPTNANDGIHQALKVQADSDRKNSLLLLYGTFWSPLYRALNSRDPALNAKAHAAILGHYVSTDWKQSPAWKSRYLKNMKGWLITEGNARNMATMLSASAGANAGFFGLKADISSSARLSYDARFSSTEFAVILDTALNGTTDLAPLPSMADIARSFQAATVFSPPTESTYASNGSLTLRASVLGIPDWLCSNQWQVAAPTAARVNAATSGINAVTGACDITTDVVLDKDMSELPVAFNNTRHTVVDDSGVTQTLALTHSFKTRRLSEPSLNLAGLPIAKRDPNTPIPYYLITIPMNISPAGTAQNVSLGDKRQLACAAATGDHTIYPVQIESSTGGGYRLTFGVAFGATVPTGTCRLTTDIRFQTTAASAELVRPLEVSPLFFPALASSP